MLGFHPARGGALRCFCSWPRCSPHPVSSVYRALAGWTRQGLPRIAQPCPRNAFWAGRSVTGGAATSAFTLFLKSLAGRPDDSPPHHTARNLRCRLPYCFLSGSGHVSLALWRWCVPRCLRHGEKYSRTCQQVKLFFEIWLFFASILHLLLCAGAKNRSRRACCRKTDTKKPAWWRAWWGDGLALISQEQRQCVAFFGEGPVHQVYQLLPVAGRSHERNHTMQMGGNAGSGVRAALRARAPTCFDCVFLACMPPFC